MNRYGIWIAGSTASDIVGIDIVNLEDFELPIYGRAPSTQNAVLKRPTWMINCGARKMRKTMQSRYEI